jgi:hypothetical protein
MWMKLVSFTAKGDDASYAIWVNPEHVTSVSGLQYGVVINMQGSGPGAQVKVAENIDEVIKRLEGR